MSEEEGILNYKTIAVVGCSTNPEKPANPFAGEVLDEIDTVRWQDARLQFVMDRCMLKVHQGKSQ